MNIIIFEDSLVSNLEPFSLNHASFEVKSGIYSNLERFRLSFKEYNICLVVRNQIKEILVEKYSDFLVNPQILPMGYCINGKVIWDEHPEGTHGWHFFPQAKSNIGVCNTENADNPGYRFRIFNLDTIFELYDDKAQVNLRGSETNYVLNVCNNSTSYPHMIPAMYDTAVFTEPNFGEIKRS